MVSLGQQPVSRANLLGGATGVETESGVVIDFSAVQLATLAGRSSLVSINTCPADGQAKFRVTQQAGNESYASARD